MTRKLHWLVLFCVAALLAFGQASPVCADSAPSTVPTDSILPASASAVVPAKSVPTVRDAVQPGPTPPTASNTRTVSTPATTAAPPASANANVSTSAIPPTVPSEPRSLTPQISPESAEFLADLAELTRHPHRLAGTEYGSAASSYVEERLRAMGLEQVMPLDMPVWQARTTSATLTIDGTTLSVVPLRPNVTTLSVTPEGGLRGPLVYLGRGRLEDYGTRSVLGAIAVLDYDSINGWSRAFALGASAVVFLGGEDPISPEPKHAAIPSNQPRFFLDATALPVDLRRDYPEARLDSAMVWQKRLARNLVVRIPGTEPRFAPDRDEPEVMVLAAALDSFGEVPELSPNARGAGNLALLLEAARQLKKAPPKRDVWLLFVNNQARYHQGARELYDAFTMSESQHLRLLNTHRDELTLLQRLHAVEKAHGLRSLHRVEASLRPNLVRALAAEANFARDDIRHSAQLLRLRGKDRRQAAALDDLALRWDELRRALHKDMLVQFLDEQARIARTTGPEQKAAAEFQLLFTELDRRTIDRFERRLRELAELAQIDNQRGALRRALGLLPDAPRPAIVLHSTLNLADQGPTWGTVVGDWTNRFYSFRQPKSDGDMPGYYGRVLNALSDAARTLPELSLLERSTLADPNLGMTFAPGSFVSSGTIAGSYGLYNLSFMTGYDRRPRDGQPADTRAALDGQRLFTQGQQALRLFSAVASSTAISLPAVFKDLSESKYPSYDSGQISGDYVGLQVSGSLKEDRPAAGAVLALWPGNVSFKDQAWVTLKDALEPAYYDPIALEAVDQTGRFRVVGFRKDMHQELMTLGILADARGQVTAITTQDKQAQKLTETMRVNLFSATAYRFSVTNPLPVQPQLFKILNASSDAPFRVNRSLIGQLDQHGFAYISEQTVNYRLKLFQTMGVTALGDVDTRHPYGRGIDPRELQGGASLTQRTARDLFRLNEGRLAQLRTRGVTSADLEILHSRAHRALEQAERAPTIAERQAAFLRSTSLSHHVYLPLRVAMDDLVHAIVLLLLLAIPFAFALERLTVCATTIYGRIAGFAAAFLATFGLLYWLHPGFAIASTPIIIFLAFAIVLLSSLVIYIVVRKFKTELRAMQGQSAGVHGLEVSQAGTLLAAVGMGMSTMRRRRTRTTLTAITVVMLTFTILSFASFSRTVGVRSTYQGPELEQVRAPILLRRLDFSAIEPGTLAMLSSYENNGGLLAPQYWLVRQQTGTERLSIAETVQGRSLTIDAVMGLTPTELARFGELSSALGQGSTAELTQALERGEVFLPPIVQKVLGLRPGDSVLLNGRKARFAGAFNSASFERLRHLDGRSFLPVNFQDPMMLASGSSASSGTQDETKLILADEVDRNFVHLSADQVVIASAQLVEELGGDLHTISLYPPPQTDARELGKKLAELVVMPVWAVGGEGVERMVFTVLTEVSGGFGLFVPLLLGGLIIFGTLLGSISDREREIYTFSALGLSPGHVGALFFAEAAVYAVVGGMGGQLLAQFVGLGATLLSRAGLIQPTSINYSSTNSLFAIGVVMATVLVSAVYPAFRASRSANPGLARSWKLPAPEGDELRLTFPFTVSAYDITGVMSFLAEHFRHHDDAGLGDFASTSVHIEKSDQGHLILNADLALAPFDLGVTQRLRLMAQPSEIPGIDEVAIHITRHSGTQGDWVRANRVFIKNLRRQFLLWRTLSGEMIEQYRLRTLEELGASVSAAEKEG